MTYLSLLKKVISNKQVHNFGFLFSIQASNIIVSVVTIPLIIGAIGVEELGAVDLSLSIIYTLNIIVSYGYNLSAPKEIAINFADQNELSNIFSRVLFSKLILASILCASLTIVSKQLGQYSTILLCSATVLFAEALLPHWLAQGLEKMHILSIGNLLSKIAYLGLLLWFVEHPDDSFLVNFLLGVSGILVNLSLIVYVTKFWGISLKKVRLFEVWQSLKDNFYLFLSSIAGYVSINSGIIILSFFASAYMLGAYSLAERVIRVLRLIPTIVIQAIYPKASRLYMTDKEAFYAFLRKAYSYALLLCLGVSQVAFLFAPFIVDFLAGERIPESVAILRIIAFVPFLACFNIANMVLVLVSDNRRALVKSTWISFCLMLVICSGLAYSFGGTGLAVGLVLTEVFIFMVQLYFNLQNIRSDTLRFYSLDEFYKSQKSGK